MSLYAKVFLQKVHPWQSLQQRIQKKKHLSATVEEWSNPAKLNCESVVATKTTVYTLTNREWHIQVCLVLAHKIVQWQKHQKDQSTHGTIEGLTLQFRVPPRQKRNSDHSKIYTKCTPLTSNADSYLACLIFWYSGGAVAAGHTSSGQNLTSRLWQIRRAQRTFQIWGNADSNIQKLDLH